MTTIDLREPSPRPFGAGAAGALATATAPYPSLVTEPSSCAVGVLPGSRYARGRVLVIIASVLADLLAVGAGYALAVRKLDASWVTIPVWLGCFAAYGLYDRRRLVAPSEEAGRLFHSVLMATIGALLVAFLLRIGVTRRWVALVWVCCLLTVGLTRLVVRKAVHLLHSRGLLSRRVLIVGSNEEGHRIGRTLLRQSWMGYRPVGIVSAGREANYVGAADPIPTVGSLDDLDGVLNALGVEVVVVASTALDPGQLPDVCASLHALGIETRISAGLPQVAASRVTIEPLDGAAVLSVRPNQLSAQQNAIKRVVDIAASVVLLVLTAPAMAVIAMLVRLTSSGPIVFRQVRVGAAGSPFTFYKFRTMVADAERLRPGLLDLNEADGLLFKISTDPRVTKVGRILRRWGLDELPQLYNVLLGDMSLVGPRPPLPEETERYDEWVRGRLRVKPGITGLWQVNGGHQLSFNDYVRYDLFYIENWSLVLDLYILARTVPALLLRRGVA